MNKREIVQASSAAIVLAVLLLIPLFISQTYILHVLIVIGINIVLASSLRFIATIGQFSLAHAGMVSIGAYTSALLVTKLGFSFWVSLPLAGLTAMIIACLVGYPFVRLKGIYFTMVTLFLTEFISLLATEWRTLTAGVQGIISIPPPNAIIIPGLLNLTFTSKVDFYYLALVMVGFTLLSLYAIESSRIGVTFSSIQQSEPLAESIGVNSSGYRVFAFSLGSFFAGIAGAFYSHYFSAIAPGSFGFLLSINVFIYMVVGGMRRFSGPVVGAVILTLIPEIAGEVKEYEPLVFAGILLLVIFFLRDGLVSLPGLFMKRRASGQNQEPTGRGGDERSFLRSR
jgi:branched-chain amino acid transport system permease protein